MTPWTCVFSEFFRSFVLFLIIGWEWTSAYLWQCSKVVTAIDSNSGLALLI